MEFAFVEDKSLLFEIVMLRIDVFVSELSFSIDDQFTDEDKYALHVACLSKGVVIAYARVDRREESLFISRVCTKRSMRKMGIASSLINYIVEYARTNQYKYIELDAFNKVIPYYQKFGFRLVDPLHPT